jgi:hypothetical protein
MLQQNLNCPICLSITEDPWESNCCGHLFCNKCIQNVKDRKCPICRTKNTLFRENAFAKIILSNMLVKCPYGCDLVTPVANLKLHKYQCEEATFKCSIEKDCRFEGTKKESIKHFADKHSEKMLILAEHYPSLKSIYDKNSIFEKFNKMKIQEKELEKNFKENLNFNENIEESPNTNVNTNSLVDTIPSLNNLFKYRSFGDLYSKFNPK